MTWLYENPWRILAVGAIMEIVLLVVLLRTGRGSVLVIMAVVGAMTMALVAVERLVVTDAEAVESALNHVAVALTHNDVADVLECISPTADAMRARARQILPQVVINEARVLGDLKINVNELPTPRTATALFSAHFSGRYKRETTPYSNALLRFRVTLRKEGDRWLLVDYEDRTSGR